MDSVSGFMIPADDMERARKFYADAFGWTSSAGGEGNGAMLMTTEVDETYRPTEIGRINGALSPRKQPDPGIQLGNEVASPDEPLERIQAVGGEIVMPKTDMGGYGWSARFRDTEGNLISLWEPKPMDEGKA